MEVQQGGVEGQGDKRPPPADAAPVHVGAPGGQGGEGDHAGGQADRPPVGTQAGLALLVDVPHAAQGQDQHAAEEDHAGGVAPDHEVAQGPERDAPEERVPGDPDDPRSLVLGPGVDHALAADLGRVRRGHAGDHEEEGDGHQDQRQPAQDQRRLPERDEGRRTVGEDRPQQRGAGDQGIEAAEAVVAEPRRQRLAQHPAGQQEVPADEEQGGGEEVVEVSGHGAGLSSPAPPASRAAEHGAAAGSRDKTRP